MLEEGKRTRNVGTGQEKTGKKLAIWLLTLALRLSITFGCGSLITRDFHFGKKLVERQPKITRNRLTQKQIEFLTLSAARASRQLGDQHKVGGQAAAFSCGRNSGYQRRNASSNSLFKTFVRICSSR